MIKMKFEKAAPESVGISPKGIEGFIKRLEKDELDMHSILIMRGGKLVFEGYYEPYGKNSLHRMFSISKSLTSIAIGMMIFDRDIGLDDKICDYFPEFIPEDGVHPYIRETTIRHMLTMTTPHDGTTYDKYSGKGWVKSFFTKTPSHKPGTVFSYDTSASHVLAALVEKRTGKRLIDYVRDKGLMISDEAYFIPDGEGVSQGGSGLLALPYDLLIIADMLMRGGVSGDKRLLTAGYVQEMTSFQVPNHAKGYFPAEQQGYGYQIWRTQRGGFMMYGLAGQLAVCFPEKDLIFVTTADLTDRKGGIQRIFDAFFDEVYDTLDGKLEPSDLPALEKGLAVMPLENKDTYDIDKIYEFTDNKPGLKAMRIVANSDSGSINLEFSDGIQSIGFGFGELRFGGFVKYNCPYAASAGWCGENILIIKANLIGECAGKIFIELSFSGSEVTVFMRKTEETLFNEFNGFAQSK